MIGFVRTVLALKALYLEPFTLIHLSFPARRVEVLAEHPVDVDERPVESVESVREPQHVAGTEVWPAGYKFSAYKVKSQVLQCLAFSSARRTKNQPY